jgi:hypothetical protein
VTVFIGHVDGCFSNSEGHVLSHLGVWQAAAAAAGDDDVAEAGIDRCSSVMRHIRLIITRVL